MFFSRSAIATPLRVLAEYGRYFNDARPHQDPRQTIPVRTSSTPSRTGAIVAFPAPVLNGLHHDYRRAAAIRADGSKDPLQTILVFDYRRGTEGEDFYAEIGQEF